MICNDCKKRADRDEKPGCDRDCGTGGCSCQHRGKKRQE